MSSAVPRFSIFSDLKFKIFQFNSGTCGIIFPDAFEQTLGREVKERILGRVVGVIELGGRGGDPLGIDTWRYQIANIFLTIFLVNSIYTASRANSRGRRVDDS